jgi:hypothetical protein
MVKIAICYWGMTRSTRYVYNSHINNLFNVFKNNDIDYDIFMHTWKTLVKGQFIGPNYYDFLVDYEEYKLLNPNFYKIDNQIDFLHRLNFEDYFNKELYEQHGDSCYEWIPQLIRNHLCALESQKRVYNMVVESNNCYDYIVYIRPDVEILNPIDINWINSDFDIILPNYDHYEGLNDRFAIIPFDKAVKYSTRIDEIIEFRKNCGRIVSEKYVKYIVDNYYPNVQFINFIMRIIRPNGQSSN